MAYFNPDDEECNFIDSELDDDSVPASERQASNLVSLKQTMRKEDTLGFEISQKSIIKTL